MLFAVTVLCILQVWLHLTLVTFDEAGAVVIPILWTKKLELKGFGNKLKGHSSERRM